MQGRFKLVALTVAAALPGFSLAVGQMPDGSTPEQKALIAGDPAFRQVQLRLEDVPAGTSAPRALFNGRDLAGWDTWLGFKNNCDTYAPTKEKPIGLNHDEEGVFRVVTEDGMPAIFSSGKTWGGLLTKEVFGNYHLRVQYKWGKNSWVPGMPRNNGVLYHSHGPYGAFFDTWMSAVEFEILPGSVGMVLAVGDSHKQKSFQKVHWKVGLDVEVGQDMATPYPHRRYMPGGKQIQVKGLAFNVEASTNAEKPIGEWNTLDSTSLATNRSTWSTGCRY
jgi:hypothetical protein